MIDRWSQKSGQMCMRSLNLNSLLLVLFMLGVFADYSNSSPSYAVRCPRGYYTNRAHSDVRRRCVPCYRCPSGYGVRRPCAQFTDTVCEACTVGHTYANDKIPHKRCRECSTCAPHQHMERNCTLTSDTQCTKSCDKGFYWDNAHYKCRACSWCFPQVLHPGDMPLVADCDVRGIPTDYQCAEMFLDSLPNQTSWLEYKRAKEARIRQIAPGDESSAGDSEASGDFTAETTDRISNDFFPNDDEELEAETPLKHATLDSSESENVTAVSEIYKSLSDDTQTLLPVPLSPRMRPAPIQNKVNEELDLKVTENRTITLLTIVSITLAAFAVALSIFTLVLMTKHTMLVKRYFNAT
ncbi:uncharacterized protein LOC108950065 [Ciona intestinalis]